MEKKYQSAIIQLITNRVIVAPRFFSKETIKVTGKVGCREG